MADRTVSIALATYNGARFLAEQLASYTAQSRLPDEIVVGDDGSSDATLEILEGFAAHAPFPVRITRNLAAMGPAGNFFETARRCSGDVILFSDQDDIWHADKIEALLDHFAHDEQCWLITHDAALVDADGKPIGRTLAGQIEAARGGEAARDLVAGCCMAFDRRLLALFDDLPRTRQHDAILAHVTTLLGLRCHIPDVLIDYRRHGGNVSESFMSAPDQASTWRRFRDRLRRARSEPVAQSLQWVVAAREDLISALLKHRAMMAKVVPPELLEATFDYLRDHLEIDRRRLAIHQAAIPARPAKLSGAVLQGTYRGFDGLLSFLRDLSGLLSRGGGA